MSITADSDLTALRILLHAAIDEIVDRVASGADPDARTAHVEPDVATGEPIGAWHFRWPDGSVERFDSGRGYELRTGGDTIMARLAKTTRRAWGRDRLRWVVFLDLGRSGSTNLYPAAEFVETDEGDLASTIPDPERPRSKLSDGAKLPQRFEHVTIKRADEVFRQVKRGPSLRLVVRADDEVGMLRHGHWVATTRGRV